MKITYCVFAELPLRIAIRKLFPAAEVEALGDGYWNVTTTTEDGDTDRFVQYCEDNKLEIEFV